jgi:hypothetical protein
MPLEPPSSPHWPEPRDNEPQWEDEFWDPGEIEALVLGRAGALTRGGLRHAIVQAVMEVNAEKARKRREAARQYAQVEVYAEPSGNAAWKPTSSPWPRAPAASSAPAPRPTAPARSPPWAPSTRNPKQIHPIVTDPRCEPTRRGGHAARRLSTRFFPPEGLPGKRRGTPGMAVTRESMNSRQARGGGSA